MKICRKSLSRGRGSFPESPPPPPPLCLLSKSPFPKVRHFLDKQGSPFNPFWGTSGPDINIWLESISIAHSSAPPCPDRTWEATPHPTAVHRPLFTSQLQHKMWNLFSIKCCLQPFYKFILRSCSYNLSGGGVTHPKQEEVSLSVCPAGRDMFLSMFLLFYVAVSPDVLVYGPRDLWTERERERERERELLFIGTVLGNLISYCAQTCAYPTSNFISNQIPTSNSQHQIPFQ